MAKAAADANRLALGQHFAIKAAALAASHDKIQKTYYFYLSWF
jgi:hypothetical protein